MKRYLFTIINQFSLLISYVIIIIFARNLSLSKFGELSYIKNITMFGMVTVWFGLERGSLFYLKNRDTGQALKYISGFKLCTAVMSIIALCGFIHFDLIRYNTSYFLISLIGLIFIFAAFDIKYLFDYMGKVHLEILINFIKFIPLLIYVIVTQINNYPLEIEFYFFFLFNGLFLYVVVQHLYMNVKPSAILSLIETHRILKFSGFIAIGIAASYLNHYADTFMIMHLLNSESVGVYSAAYTLFLGLTMFTGLLIRFFISENLGSNFSMAKTIRYSGRMLLLSTIISIVAYSLSKLFVTMVLGEKYIGSVSVLNVLLLAFIVIASGSVYGSVLIVEGKTKFYMYSMLIAMFTNVILNYYFIPRYGIVAAAYTTGISNLVAVITTFLFYRYKVVLQRI